MRKVKITEDFQGYPDGKKRRNFAKGEEVEVPAAFADLIVGKGHAKEIAGETMAAVEEPSRKGRKSQESAA